MKKIILPVCLALMFNYSFGQTNDKLSTSLIQSLRAATHPNIESNNDHHSGRELTPLIALAKKNWSALSNEAKLAFRTYTTRPTLTDEVIYSTSNFDFHFTVSGSDAVDPVDNNTNDIPDYVEDMGNIFEEVYGKYSNDLNYVMPPNDGTEGGSDKYDIYITSLGSGLYGFVAPENTIGDNPNSKAITETSSSTSWMNMNNDYTWTGQTDQSVQVTAAHEYFHSIQFGYTDTPTNFIAEATAALMEDVIYPGADDNFQYMKDIFSYPDVALNIKSDDINTLTRLDGRWYGGWTFFKYLTEKTSVTAINEIYSKCITTEEMSAVDFVLSNKYGTSFTQLFEDWLIANACITPQHTFSSHTYSRGGAYSTYLNENIGISNVRIEGEVNEMPATWKSNIDGNSTLMRLSADYFKIKLSSDFHAIVSSEKSSDLNAKAILFKSSSITTVPLTLSSNTLSSDVLVNESDSIYIMVYRNNYSVNDTLSIDYTLDIAEAQSGTVDGQQISDLSLFPNPAVHTIYISSNTTYKNIVITSIDGIEVMNTPISSKNINLSALENGVYTVQLTDASNNSVIQKLVVSK